MGGRLEGWDQGGSRSGFRENPNLAGRRWASCHVLTWLRESLVSPPLLTKAPILVNPGSILMTSFNNNLLKYHIFNIVTWGIRASIQSLRRHNLSIVAFMCRHSWSTPKNTVFLLYQIAHPCGINILPVFNVAEHICIFHKKYYVCREESGEK